MLSCNTGAGPDVNATYFGSNLLSLAAGLAEPHKTDITYYLSIKGVTYLNITLEEAKQAGQNATNLRKQIFFKAINEDKLEVIKKFVEIYGFDVNTEYYSNTPLSTAINLKSKKEVVKCLISKKADTNAAMSVVATEGNLDGIKLLLNAGAKINDTDNESPLMLASEHRHVSVVKYLLEHGADYNVKGWERDNLNSDVSSQLTKITEISTLCKKANNTNTQKILDKISLTSISSNYDGYRNLSPEQIE
ncbi:ankyrin repeat domain-containing protein [Rickettsia endosymbiont of Cantharis rufa]|uniref:ankyrin repeat domain-containing protein n=1 Tax=Rickettsia endosymbiont of Cantharis rufa TaxID=3066248 RepID=UPI0031334551